MTKMHQLLAVERDLFKATDRRITDTYQNVQKGALLTGLSRVYTPRDEEGERRPSESQLVQLTASKALEEIQEQFTRLMDHAASRDWGNLSTKADVVIDGSVIIADAPATYLLWLEKQLTDIATIVSKLPVLDPTKTWRYDETKGCYVTETTESLATKKVPKVLVKAEATDKHPAQTEVYQEDVVVGTWATTHLSGALPADQVIAMGERARTALAAVKQARAKANEAEVENKQVAAPLLSYIFG